MGFVPNACGSGRPSREAFPRFSVFWGVLCRIKIFIPCALCETWLQRRPGLAFSSWESSRPRPRVSRGRSPLPGPALLSRALRWFARPPLARARLAPVAFGSGSSASGPFPPPGAVTLGEGASLVFTLVRFASHWPVLLTSARNFRPRRAPLQVWAFPSLHFRPSVPLA